MRFFIYDMLFVFVWSRVEVYLNSESNEIGAMMPLNSSCYV